MGGRLERVGVVESVTDAVNENVPVVVGVPSIAPVWPSTAGPPGSEPEVIFQWYGCLPPAR